MDSEPISVAPVASERYINSEAIDLILARVCRQALSDYRANRYCPNKPSAAAFLIAAGIVDATTGVIDWHGFSPKLAGRPTARGAGGEDL